MTSRPDMNRTEIAVLVLRGWRRWPSLARILAGWGIYRVRLGIACWRAGVSIAEAKRLARLEQLTGGAPR